MNNCCASTFIFTHKKATMLLQYYHIIPLCLHSCTTWINVSQLAGKT